VSSDGLESSMLGWKKKKYIIYIYIYIYIYIHTCHLYFYIYIHVCNITQFSTKMVQSLKRSWRFFGSSLVVCGVAIRVVTSLL
jgi:hypothetical protein